MTNTFQGCHGCPFEFSDYSEQIQNYGCLPTPQEIITMRVKHGRTWACHCNIDTPCRGALQHLQEQNLPFKVVNKELLTEQSPWHLYIKEVV